MAEKEMQKREASSPVETERTKSMKVFIPRVDICETKDAIVLLADMPGVDEKSIDITLEKNVLTLTGRVEPETHEGYVAAYTEYEAGDYERAFTLSDEINRDGIEASVKNGVLRLTLPKAEPVKLRKINVKSA
ncbi:MAG TPA: Hsp20/alpha crystallin family protein [Syntrophales bacterium]|nr:Hsp20/alpha crystallin family protein [Syntrophales bacterium]